MAMGEGATWHTGSAIFDGKNLKDGCAIFIEEGQVSDLETLDDIPAGAQVKTHDGIISPGFFDVQVNGGGGVLLNAAPTVAGVEKILAAHRKLGTTAILPTVITDHPSVTEAAADACLTARDLPGMMGIHIEGPHISTAKRGTHDKGFLRDLDSRTLQLVERFRSNELPVLITVAPEAATPAQVSQLVEMGAVVSIGHSNASADDAQGLLNAGASCFTHLFNAMSQMEGRAPGVVGAAIGSDAWCSIIADGIHVDPAMVLLSFRARPTKDRMIAISDAMPTVGGANSFRLYEMDISLKDGRLVNTDGALAGAHLTVLGAIRNLVSYGLPLDEALRTGRHNPAQMMGLGAEMELIGSQASDLLVLSDKLELLQVGLV